MNRFKRIKRKSMYIAIAIASIVFVLAAGLVDDLNTQTRLGNTHKELRLTNANLERTDSDLSATLLSLRTTLHVRFVDQLELNAASTELASAKAELTKLRSGLALGNFGIGSVTECLSGVVQALNSLGQGSNSSATTALAGVSSVCQSLLGNQSGGPVYPFDFPDPFVLVSGGTYYAYGTNSTSGNIQMMESSDLMTWHPLGDALPNLPGWARPDFTWAPAVLQLGNTYLLYYTAALAIGGLQCISVASAPDPAGPFVDTSTKPVVCQPANGGSIDPEPFVDASGKPYLAWKSNGGGGTPATIWSQALTPNGLSVAKGNPSQLLQPNQIWEAGTVEAPSMLLSGGTYYLFYSGNDWDTSSYAIGVATCQGPLGPCIKPLSQPIYSSQPDLQGPGGPSVFVDAQGQLEMAFHAWIPGAVGYPNARLLFIRQLAIQGGIPVVQPPA